MLLQWSAYSNITGTGSQVTLGFPHSQFRLRVASPKVREHGRTTPVAYELASDTYHGLGVMTSDVPSMAGPSTPLPPQSGIQPTTNSDITAQYPFTFSYPHVHL